MFRRTINYCSRFVKGDPMGPSAGENWEVRCRALVQRFGVFPFLRNSRCGGGGGKTRRRKAG